MLATADQTDAISAPVFQVSIKLHHKKITFFFLSARQLILIQQNLGKYLSNSSCFSVFSRSFH